MTYHEFECVTKGQMDGWTDRQMDGWTDRQTDRRTEGQSIGQIGRVDGLFDGPLMEDNVKQLSQLNESIFHRIFIFCH